jgi:5-methylcytosine-specific restriction endonuclease McrA
MRRIVATTEDSFAIHKVVVSEKSGARRVRLEHHHPEVEARIRMLATHGPFDLPVDDLGHACAPAVHHPCLHEDLRHCWRSPTATLEALKQRLIDELGYFPCPYCGIGEADTFDHYLPRSHFPEFSATAANLVPCCNRCNLLKKTHAATVSERILHPALDPLDQRLFKCSIVESPDGLPTPTYMVDEIAAAELGLVGICQFHFERLDLASRFRRVTAPHLSEFLNLLETSSIPWGPIAANAARDLARGVGLSAMPNKWDVMLYRAVAEWMDAL